ncbi:MAG: M48 family metallopeptidase [Oligoflexia bacterium]|nr:M48 family metallopeptidase [Oligoflexia bacterium]
MKKYLPLLFSLLLYLLNTNAIASGKYTVIDYIRTIEFKLVHAANNLGIRGSFEDVPPIFVEDSFEVNASSGISINYGMLNYIEYEDELAGLLGHELAHNYLNHHINDDLEKEFVADKFASYLASKAGYNPHGLHSLIDRIANDPNLKLSTSLTTERSTHPPIKERSIKLNEYLKEQGLKEEKNQNPEVYRSMISLLYSEKEVSDEELKNVILELASIRDEAVEAEYEHDPRTKVQLLFKSLEKLSKVAIRYPHFKIYRDSLHLFNRGGDSVFISDILIKFSPTWLQSANVLGAKFYTALETINQLALSVCPYVGDSIDLYELLYGKSFSDGSQLGVASRTFAGMGVILGSRQIYEGVSNIIHRLIRDIPEMSPDAKKVLLSLENKLSGARLVTSEHINKELSLIYIDPPFKADTKILVRTTTEDEKFIRFLGKDADSIAGRWIVREDEIAGLNRAEIQEKLALPFEIDSIADVKIPKNIELYEGLANSLFGKQGGGWQIYINIKNRPPNDWFTRR